MVEPKVKQKVSKKLETPSKGVKSSSKAPIDISSKEQSTIKGSNAENTKLKKSLDSKTAKQQPANPAAKQGNIIDKVKKEMEVSKVKIQQIASGAGRYKDQIQTLKGLGLNKMNKIVELEDTKSVRGMINKVSHLVKVIN